MKIVKAILKIVLCICIIVVLVIAGIAMKSRRCEAIKVTFMPKNSVAILTQSDVQQLLAQNHITYLNKKVKEVEPDKISVLLQKHPYVDEVSGVYFSGTTLRINLKLKQPILRLYPRQGSQYLMDDKGRLLPSLPAMQERLLIANGAIFQEYRADLADTCNAVLHQLYVIASAINRNPFLKAQISQLYVTGDPKSAIEMVPVMGNQTILLGDTSNLENKLNNLQTAYKEGISYIGFDKYSQLDLRFKNRVVAKKR
jgi:cell division protein FtsQ